MKDSKNQIIRSMKSYETGGSTDDSCMEEYTDFDGRRKKRRKKGGCKKTYGKRSIPDGAKTALKVAGAVGAGVLGWVNNRLINKEKLNLKKGGAVKKQNGGPIGGGKFLKKHPKIAAKVANTKTLIRNVKKIVKPRTKG
jgi:hypothetical protein